MKQTSHTTFFLPLCALLLGAGPVAAEVTIEEKLRVKGTGLMSMMNMSGTSVTRISGDRGRTDSSLQMESRMMRMFGGLGPAAEIVRLDEERLMSLDLKAKRELRRQLFGSWFSVTGNVVKPIPLLVPENQGSPGNMH